MQGIIIIILVNTTLSARNWRFNEAALCFSNTLNILESMAPYLHYFFGGGNNLQSSGTWYKKTEQIV